MWSSQTTTSSRHSMKPSGSGTIVNGLYSRSNPGTNSASDVAKKWKREARARGDVHSGKPPWFVSGHGVEHESSWLATNLFSAQHLLISARNKGRALSRPGQASGVVGWATLRELGFKPSPSQFIELELEPAQRSVYTLPSGRVHCVDTCVYRRIWPLT